MNLIGWIIIKCLRKTLRQSFRQLFNWSVSRLDSLEACLLYVLLFVTKVLTEVKWDCLLNCWLVEVYGRTSDTSVNFYQTARRNNAEDSRLHIRRLDNLKSHYSKSVCELVILLINLACQLKCSISEWKALYLPVAANRRWKQQKLLSLTSVITARLESNDFSKLLHKEVCGLVISRCCHYSLLFAMKNTNSPHLPDGRMPSLRPTFCEPGFGSVCQDRCSYYRPVSQVVS
jgi:hypothetical protein